MRDSDPQRGTAFPERIPAGRGWTAGGPATATVPLVSGGGCIPGVVSRGDDGRFGR